MSDRAIPLRPRPSTAAQQPASLRGLTNMRLAVLHTIEREGRPITAYEILRRLSHELGRSLSPPSIYRSLDYLVREGSAARIESLNSYLALKNTAPSSGRLFLLCESCGGTTELAEDSLSRCLSTISRREGFGIERSAVELLGICRDCRGSEVADRIGAEARP